MVAEQHICAEIVPIFSYLDQDSLVKISAITRHEQVSKGALVMSPTDQKRLVILAQGKVKVYQLSSAGKEQLLRIMEPGDFEGEKLLFKAQDEPLYGEALQDSVICTLSRAAFQKLLLTYPAISLKLLEAITDKMARLEKQANLINIESIESRIVTYLIDLTKANGETHVTIPMKLKELATYIGTTPETLSRKLKHLESDGLIERQGRKIRLLDYEYLEDFY
ncbi:Crp/Fnr family transcriptional regulator [Latilactobacillus graminis]|uniref:Crp/Fnr family transcriptional regulator n=1 Tax=Latilactobacillus graminis TaxID=60519 RepID=A0ABX6C5N4_9LACO|nr:Crp/Fnr family transcriptional regulator [Latilactobacillus graminis]QFP78892.1 Crp/Fnr family transcriptional regulator [Latilactobacillus graminis]